MNLKASYEHRVFKFKQPSGTSRGVLTEKHAWFIRVWNPADPSVTGLGECSIIEGLSPDFKSFVQYENKLDEVMKNPFQDLEDFPSIKFGIECALKDLENGGRSILFHNSFSKGKQKIPINGLIWMGEKSFMEKQIREKIEQGFSTIKMKIGTIDFDTELELLSSIRSKYSEDQITLRVDANGAFSPEDALKKLNALSQFGIHSIEQPIKQGQTERMSELCKITPVPIALDEELIGIHRADEKKQLLQLIQPQFIILKPSLHGGISGTQEWIDIAVSMGIKWWMTSALESNIGLNAICQLTAEYDNPLPQGLGTGSLYSNNVESNLVVSNGTIKLMDANQPIIER